MITPTPMHLFCGPHGHYCSPRVQWAALFGVALTIVAGMAFVTSQIIEIRRRLQPLQTVHRVWFESPVVKAGGRLTVNFEISRTETCIVIVHRFIVDAKTNTVVWSILAPAALTQRGDHQRGQVTFMLPPSSEVPPGNYHYRSLNYNTQCDDGRSIVIPSPTTDFTVVP